MNIRKNYSFIDVYIGQKIKEARYKNGLSLADMASALGISRSRYNRYETGDNSFPIDMYNKACKTVHLDPMKLFTEAQEFLKEKINAALQEEQ